MSTYRYDSEKNLYWMQGSIATVIETKPHEGVWLPHKDEDNRCFDGGDHRRVLSHPGDHNNGDYFRKHQAVPMSIPPDIFDRYLQVLLGPLA